MMSEEAFSTSNPLQAEHLEFILSQSIYLILYLHKILTMLSKSLEHSSKTPLAPTFTILLNRLLITGQYNSILGYSNS